MIIASLPTRHLLPLNFLVGGGLLHPGVTPLKCRLATMGGDLLTERVGPLRRLRVLLTEGAFRPLKCTFSHGSQWLPSFMSSAPLKETINIYIVLPERNSTFHVRF